MSQIAFLGVFFSLLVTTCFASPMAPGPAMRIAGQFGGFEIGLALASVRQLSLGPLLVLAVAPLGGGLLRLALSRRREGEADLEAAELTGDPRGLAPPS